ncbi:hypothetical protein ATO4_01765 [Aurantimonas sp. 22II-16-19i]|nr:hypothetical protein ATO4_01765 [Aurantimonas sp. 22II-16-19i]
MLTGISATALCAVAPPALAAGDIDDPATPMVTVTDGGGRTMALSRNDLARIEQTRFETTAPFMTTPRRMEGPSIAALLRSFDPDRTFERVEIAALDAYLVAADVASLVADGAILAIRQDGAFLPVADKGPALLIFPFDDRPALQDKRHYGLCIWQIAEIRLS